MSEFDSSLLYQVIQLRRPWLDDLMILASALGAGGFIWIIFGSIAGIFPAYTAAMWRLWLAVGLSFVLVDHVMKPVVERARPFEVLSDIPLIDARPTSPAFPSGHAAMAAAGALAGTRLMPSAGMVLWPFAVLVTVSRVYLGVHWPSDVLGGAVVGLGTTWFVLGGSRPRTTMAGYGGQPRMLDGEGCPST